jgi:hypothetical protein
MAESVDSDSDANGGGRAANGGGQLAIVVCAGFEIAQYFALA